VQLAELAERCLGALAVSRFNQLDLDRAGYARTAVVPILRDCTTLRHDVDDGTLRRLAATSDGGGVDAVFVGRIVPNKAQHDLVKLVATYERMYGDSLRMHLVGSAACVPYADAVEAYAARLGVAARVHVTGAVGPAELAAYYHAADVFVSASEHEGFCVPVLEALACDAPVVAYAAAAVPETLGDGGIALPTKAAPVLAAAVHRVVSDGALRADLRARGARRVQAFDRDLVAQQLRRTLTEWGVIAQ
jgi:glycosyltransferase involved in cell wall biosynthesis